MKQIGWIIMCMYSLTAFSQPAKPAATVTYTLIKQTKAIPGDINQAVINKLDEPLRAIAAYYSSLGGSNCRQDPGGTGICDLTTALGLGNQGSEKHKAIIQKWFPNDNAAKQLLAQDCYQPPSGASSFSDYAYLSLTQQGNVVTINYSLMVYNHGSSTTIKGPDKVIIKGNEIQILKRSIWKKI